MLTTEQIADYHREGFCIARGFFGADEIDLLRRAAKEDRELDRRSFGRADGEGGTVRMQVFQESSAVVPGATTTAGPTTDKSSIETNVVVDDGQTIVLGGLLKDEFSDTEDRVPGLGGLPVLGNLFKSENRKRSKSNLMVFLRPVVLRTQQSADSVTLDRYEAIRAQQQIMQLAPGAAVPEPANGVLPPLKTAPAAAAAPSTR